MRCTTKYMGLGIGMKFREQLEHQKVFGFRFEGLGIGMKLREKLEVRRKDAQYNKVFRFRI